MHRQGQRRGLQHPADGPEDQQWQPCNLGNPLYNALLAPIFEWGIAISLSRWLADAARYLSCASDAKPFPWAPWPPAQ